MALDYSVGGELDLILQTAIRRSRDSLSSARSLLESGFSSAAHIWAVRSVEIFIKEFVLLPLFLEELDGDWKGAWKSVRSTFKSGEWGRALRIIDQAYGPLDSMRTDDGKEVWSEWKSKIVADRGNIVHGLIDAPASKAEIVIVWADLIINQVTMRLIVTKKHPLSGLFATALSQAFDS